MHDNIMNVNNNNYNKRPCIHCYNFNNNIISGTATGESANYHHLISWEDCMQQDSNNELGTNFFSDSMWLYMHVHKIRGWDGRGQLVKLTAEARPVRP